MTRLGRQAWWAVAIAAVAGLLLSLVVVVGGGEAPQADEVVGEAAVSAPRTGGAPVDERSSPSREREAGQVARRRDASIDSLGTRQPRPPVRLRVPALDLDAVVEPVGVAEDRQMQLPANPRVLGWYRFGPAPGDRGSVVVAGHVDSRRFGVGPLVALQRVTAGARVEVVTGSGRTRTYRVDSVQRFDRQALPAGVFSRTGTERLRLVTCTGPFLPDAGGYQQNLVVTAVPV